MYFNNTDAERLISREAGSLEGVKLTYSSPTEQDRGGNEDVDEKEIDAEDFPDIAITSDDMMILVEGVPDNVSLEYVKLLFENEPRTGGGEVKDIDGVPEGHLVSFNDTSGEY